MSHTVEILTGKMIRFYRLAVSLSTGLFFITVLGFGQSGELSPANFNELCLQSLIEMYPEITFNAKDEFTIEAMDKETRFTLHLENPYREYQESGESIPQIISKYVTASGSLFGTAKPLINIDRIVPTIKPVEYFEELNQIAKENSIEVPRLVYEFYNEKLIIVYAEDTDLNIQYFSEEDFDKLSINRDTLLKLAVRNLEKILPDIQKFGNNQSFGLVAGGLFEASLILIEHLWKETLSVDGDFIVSIPNRDLIFVTGSNDSIEVERIHAIALNAYKTGDHPLSPSLFQWNGEKFEEYRQ